MARYYEQVQEAIKNNEKELAHLKDELRGLRAVEKDTPRESYQRQHAQILYHIDQEQKRLAKNQALLDNYNTARDGIAELRVARDNEDLVRLRASLGAETNPERRREILEELEGKEAEHNAKIEEIESRVQTNMGNLTDELAEELRQSFLTQHDEVKETDEHTPSMEMPLEETPENTTEAEETEITSNNKGEGENVDDKAGVGIKESPSMFEQRRLKLQSDLSAAESELASAENELQESIARFQEIFAEERTRRENEGPFGTEEELDNFTSEYMRRKIEENERFEAIRAKIVKAKRKISRAENKLEEYATLQAEARRYGINEKVYEKIKKTVSKNEVLSAIYQQRGLGEVTRHTKEGKAQADRITAEVVESVVEQLKVAGINTSEAMQGNITQTGGVNINQNGGININIIDTVNIIYGTDIPVKDGPSRTTTITSEEKDTVKRTQRERVKVRVVPHNGDEQKGKTPGQGPSDMPKGNAKELSVTRENNDDTVTDVVSEQIIPQVLYGPPPTQKIETFEEIPKVPINPVNPNGTYRLKEGQIIEDDPIKKQPPTDLVPVTQTGTAEPIIPPQVLYGPPPIKEEKEEVKIEPPKQAPPKRGLMTIMEELTEGLGLKAKDGKRYKASNVKVFKGFKDELSSGNLLYNIVHLVPAIVKLPFNLLRKATGKIMLHADSKKNIAEFKKRLEKLSDEDLMTIYTEYRGNKVLQERFPTILNTLLEERMQKFVLGKVTEINGELEQRYQGAFVSMQQLDAINDALSKDGISDERRRELEAAKKEVLRGQASNVASIRSGYITANNWLSGGLHGFSEDMKAATTKLSLVGKRFAKDHNLDQELLKRQAELERAEMQAIADGNDEMALRVFVENELLLSRNTSINGSIYGRRSTGKKYYSPLAEQLDYRDDPFIRDLFTTIAVTSATISTIQSIKVARDQANIIAENNRRMAQNNQTMQQVNQMGSDIASKRGDMMQGMESQGMQDTLTAASEIERAVLDKTGWSRGLGTSAYSAADKAGHTYYNSFFDSAKQGYENIAQQYATGQISQAQAMQLMSDLGKQTHQTFEAINTECLNILKSHAASNPQYDLTGVQSAMEYLQANPSAVEAMNQAMVDVTNAGDVLASMQLEQLIPLTTVPSTIRTVIINGAATAALAANINNSMGAKKHTYGNSVTDMLHEYNEQTASRRETSNEHSSNR